LTKRLWIADKGLYSTVKVGQGDTIYPKEAGWEIFNRAMDLKEILWNDVSNGK
jgi:hypothetical protein